MDKKIKGVKIKRLFCHIHLTWKLTRERKEIILLKGQENRGFKIPVISYCWRVRPVLSTSKSKVLKAKEDLHP